MELVMFDEKQYKRRTFWQLSEGSYPDRWINDKPDSPGVLMHKFPQSFIPDQKILWRDRNEIFEDRLYFDPDFNNGRDTQVVDNQRQHAYRIFPKDLHKYLSTGLVKLDKNLQQNYI